MKAKKNLRRLLSILLCLALFIPNATVAFASYEDGAECEGCGHYHWDDYMCECGFCSAECTNSQCYIESHCNECGDCFADKGGFCEECYLCYDCIQEGEWHCEDCFDCFFGDKESLCNYCNKCDSCVMICDSCGFCEDCIEMDNADLHCKECGNCYEDVEPCPSNEECLTHCADCCQICENCDECIFENEDKELCPDCEELCLECCAERTEMEYGCTCGICEESSDWEEHLCQDCETPFCLVDQCEYCEFCMDCCEGNSECAEGAVCVESDEYEDHFCIECGACFCEKERCEVECYEPRCRECCLALLEEAGCDGSCDEVWCIDASGLEDHLEAEHGETMEESREKHQQSDPKPEKSWTFDEVSHWHACSVCDMESHKTGSAYHSFNSEGICTVCMYHENAFIHIIKQPADVYCKTYHAYSDYEDPLSEVNNQVTFVVKAYGETGLTYQWQYNYGARDDSDDANWIDLVDEKSSWTGHEDYSIVKGAGTNTLTVMVPDHACEDAYRYRCCITDEDGNTAVTRLAMMHASHIYAAYDVNGDLIEDGLVNVGYGPKVMIRIQDDSEAGHTDYYIQSSEGHNYQCIGCYGEDSYKFKNAQPHKFGAWAYLGYDICQGGNYEYRECEICGYQEFEKYRTIRITEQPKDVRCHTTDVHYSGYNDPLSPAQNKVTFTVAVRSYGEVAYQWQYRYGNASWQDLDDEAGDWPGYGAYDRVRGATTNQLTVSVPGDACYNDYQYRCVITDGWSTVASEPAYLLASHVYETETGAEGVVTLGENVKKMGEEYILEVTFDLPENMQVTHRMESTEGGHVFLCLGDGCEKRKETKQTPHNYGEFQDLGRARDGHTYKMKKCLDCGHRYICRTDDNSGIIIEHQPSNVYCAPSHYMDPIGDIGSPKYNYATFTTKASKVTGGDEGIAYVWEMGYVGSNGTVPESSWTILYDKKDYYNTYNVVAGSRTGTLTIAVPTRTCVEGIQYRCRIVLGDQGVYTEPAELISRHIYKDEGVNEAGETYVITKFVNIEDTGVPKQIIATDNGDVVMGATLGHKEACLSCSKVHSAKPLQNHVYGGWEYFGSDTSGNAYAFRTCSDCNYREYKQVDATNITVTFDKQGGSCSTSSMRVNENFCIETLPTAVAPGTDGVFEGWYTARTKAAGRQVKDGEVFAEDTTLYAVYTYPLLVEGGVAKQGGETAGEFIESGVTLRLQAESNAEGKPFDKWAYEGVSSVLNEKYATGASFVTTESAMKLTATYSEPVTKCSVTFQKGEGAGGTMYPKTVAAGSEIVLPKCAFTAPAGKVFKAWEIGGKEYAVGATYTVSSDTVIKALWKDKEIVPVTLTYLIGEGVSGAMLPQTEAPGTEITLPACTFTAPEGKEFKAWLINGTEYAAGSKYTINADTDALAIYQVKTVERFTVTVKDSYASTTGAGKYAEGETVNIAAGSRSNYSFNGWTSNDVTITNASSKNASFVMPDKNVTVTANWTYTGGTSSGGGYTYYTIKATAGVNGAISPSGSVSVRSGKDQTFTITPATGYAISDVKIDGKSVGAVKSYTFENVKGNHTIEAIFMKANGNPQTGVFVDVPEGSYYGEAVAWAVENGIAKGTSDTTFDPNGICTRAQAVTFLWRAAGSPAPKTSTMPFTDVKAGSYYYDAVLWAVENGITKGTSDTTFSPDVTCSRAQIVTFLWRSQEAPAAGAVNPFTDVKADAYYAEAVLWAVKEDVTKGTTDTTFSPNADCTRAQIVTFIWRALAE